MKYVIALLGFLSVCFLWSISSQAQEIHVFEGKRFTAKIINNCPEGYVTCEDVTFSSRSKKTGKGITLKGRTVNLNCPEVCDFRGYEFKNGNYTYSLLTNDFNTWSLNVFESGKVISSDSGTLQ